VTNKLVIVVSEVRQTKPFECEIIDLQWAGADYTGTGNDTPYALKARRMLDVLFPPNFTGWSLI
jgi:hypothetical protein